jgi:penicillin-binding protein 1B
LRVHVPRKAYAARLAVHPIGKFLLGLAAAVLLAVVGTGTYLWIHYSRLIDEKLRRGPFAQTAMLFAAPEPISVGDRITNDELVEELQRRGYTTDRSNRTGWYHVRPDAVEIFPGVDAYARTEPGVVFIQDGVVTRIISNRDNTERPRIYLEPELFTNLFDRNRQKRRMVKYDDIPKVLVEAVLSAEDKRFFQHAGFDPIRIIRTAWVDVSKNRRYGASTISMQLARTFFLTRERTWKRKAAEALITIQLEQKLTKEEIFENYCNFVDLGWRRSFAVQGFGEAAQIHFGKDVRDLNLDEAAMLAGMIQGPNLYNPYRHPEKSLQRRNVILQLMRENDYITQAQYEEAVKAPLKLAEGGVESADAPYFVDLVNDKLQDKFQDIDFQSNSYRVYTTVDMKLQRDAVRAVQLGIKEVDDILAKRSKKYPRPQVALVAIDPRTADVKALVGGRSYGESQLDRALARRQPGSAFKPFVYAAALRTALEGRPDPITPVTSVTDEPTTFWFDGKPYEPGNYHEAFYGAVTLRQALAKSLNIPTVKFAEMTGYDEVAELGREAGLQGVQPTPALALGAYEATPLDIAGAYTIFSDDGVYVQPHFINEIRSSSGGQIFEYKPVRRDVLDPRIAYMVTNLMEEVLRTGTGAGARSRGFLLPAAGKTGTSHDAWFSGFTTKLLCVVWVGFDDNQELPLDGAKAALPIWTEFMKRAHQYREYRGVQEFSPPDGIVTVDIDPATGQLAASGCPNPRPEVFLAGTQPVEICRLHGGGARTQVAGWESEEGEKAAPAPASTGRIGARTARAERPKPATPAPAPPKVPAEQKRGFWSRIRAIFK